MMRDPSAVRQRVSATRSAVARPVGCRASPTVGMARKHAAAAGKRLEVEMA